MSKMLTQRSVEAAKSTDSRREIPDGGLTGLYLVIQPSGRKSWAVRYRYNGKSKKMTLEPTWPALPLVGARNKAREALLAVAEGSDPAATKKAEKKAARDPEWQARDSFKGIANLFIQRYARPKNRTWLTTARQLGLHPSPADPGKLVPTGDGAATLWAGRSIQGIGRRDVVELLDHYVDRGSPIMSNRVLAAVRKLFSWCVERGIIDDNPAQGVKAPSKETSRDRLLNDDEIGEFWQVSGKLGYPFGPMLRLLLLTGQRLREVSDMSWHEIDLDAQIWTIPRERTKSDRAHEVPMSVAVVETLHSLPQFRGSGYLFTTTVTSPVSGYSRAKKRLDLMMNQVRREAELDPVPHWRIHDLRRTVASGMARLGTHLPVIERVLNHSSGSFGGIVSVYQHHSYADEKRIALGAWGRFVSELVGNNDRDNIVRFPERPTE